MTTNMRYDCTITDCKEEAEWLLSGGIFVCDKHYREA